MSDVVSGPDVAPGFRMAGEINAGRGAVSGMAISPDGNVLMTTHFGDDSVSLIDTANGAVASPPPIGHYVTLKGRAAKTPSLTRSWRALSLGRAPRLSQSCTRSVSMRTTAGLGRGS